MARRLYPVDEIETLQKAPSEADVANDGGLQFRLRHVTKLQNFLESEVDHYSRCKRKYAATIKITSTLRTIFEVAATAGSIVGVGLISGGVTSVVGLPVLALSIGTGVFGVGNDVLLRKLTTKIKKHTAISALAEAKLSSVRSLVSKALTDSRISDTEFTHIQENVDDYKQKKRDIQTKTRSEFTKPVDIEKLKKDFLEQGVKIGREEQEKLKSALEH